MQTIQQSKSFLSFFKGSEMSSYCSGQQYKLSWSSCLYYSLIQTQLQCIIEHTQGCKTKRYHMLFTVCVEIESIFELGTCVSNYGDPLCGTAGILALDYVMNNPFRDTSMFSVCRYVTHCPDSKLAYPGYFFNSWKLNIELI